MAKQKKGRREKRPATGKVRPEYTKSSRVERRPKRTWGRGRR